MNENTSAAERVAFAALAACVPLVGCGSPEFPAALERAIDRNRVRDARLRTVRELPTMRVTSYLAADLDETIEQPDVELMRARALRFLDQAHRLGLDASAREIDRLPEPDLASLWATCFPETASPSDPREAIKAELRRAGELQRQAWADRIGSAERAAELSAVLKQLRRRINPPASGQGRGLRAALNWPLALSAAVARAGTAGKAAGHRAAPPDLYEPDLTSAAEWARDTPGHSIEAELLLKLAPTITQERLRRPPYDPAADKIGQVRFGGSPTAPQIDIDTEAPAVYGYWQLTKVHAKPRLQLVYVFWYPQRPQTGRAAHDLGPIDGLTLRITLDGRYRPAVFETICCCGCGHRVWVARHIEQSARREFGSPVGRNALAVERSRWPAPDWHVQALVDVPAKPDTGPILLIRAGSHEIHTLSYDRSIVFEGEVGEHRRYVVRPYEALERATVAGRPTSMFGPAGLVHGATRKNGWLLAPTGILSPGQPRQRGTHLIGNGHDDFDDPHLLEKCLKLPSDF